MDDYNQPQFASRRDITPVTSWTDIFISIAAVALAVALSLKITEAILRYAPSPKSQIITVALNRNTKNNLNYRSIKHTSGQTTSVISYPVTSQAQINQFFADKANELYVDFINASQQNSAASHQEITYSYLPVSDHFFSVTFHELCSISGHETSNYYPYTFNLESGELVTLNQILRNDFVLRAYADQSTTDKLLSTTFAIDQAQQNLIIAIDQNTQNIPFSALKHQLNFDISAEMFGISPFADKDPDKTDCTVEKCLALTFDDGPGQYTAKLLDILKNSRAKASFFVLGNRVSGHADLITRAAQEGHDIGSHSWSHRNLPLFSAGEITSDLTATTDAIQWLTGQRVKYFRPPYGNINKAIKQIASQFNQSIVLWDVDPKDWQYKNTTTVCDHIIANAHPGAIILLHDIYDTSIDAAHCVIDHLSHEYTFVNLSTLYK